MPVGAPKDNKNAEKWTNRLNVKTDFHNEKEYQDYIEANIEKFTKDVIGLGKYISHETNKAIQIQNFAGTKERVDLKIVGSKGVAMVELKYPRHDLPELRNSIGQCLNYITTAKKVGYKFDKMGLVSPVYDQRIFDIIQEFNLPIELYFLSKKQHSKITVCQTTEDQKKI